LLEENVMKSSSEQTTATPTVHATAESESCMAACCVQAAEDMARRIEKGAKAAKSAVVDKLEDGKMEAERFAKRSRYAVEDGIMESMYRMKRNPAASLAVAFAAGAAIGLLVPRFGRR
jgi:hypothetical protein